MLEVRDTMAATNRYGAMSPIYRRNRIKANAVAVWRAQNRACSRTLSKHQEQP
jgi:hypothetical protein